MRYEDASLSGSFQDQGPVARDDADQLAAGDRGPATGNLITGAGTETGSAGADSGEGAKVTAIAGAGGQDAAFASGQLRVDGEHGSLSVTARGDYVYRANANVPENSRDTFTYTLADADGQTSQARLTIEIGKTQAVVKADAQRIVPGPDGVVVLPAGVELSDVRIVGRDLLIMLPDGSQMLIVDGAVFVPQLVINDIEVPSTNLAALLIEQEPRPASGVPQSSGGNFIQEVGPLDPGTNLGDLLPPTQLEYVPPEFQEVALVEDDSDPEVGTNPLIQIDDDARPGGNAGGTGDDPDGVNLNGVLSGSGGDGQLTFALLTSGAPAGFTYVAGSNGSLLVQQNGTTVLTVTVNPATGAYSVIQNAALVHAAGSSENNALFSFSYTVTDEDGDSITGAFDINVDDDTPVIDVTAAADAGILLTTDDADTRGEASDSVSSSANFGGVFGLSQSAGADGLNTSSLTFALSTSGGASGLSQGGVAINLYLINGKVVGSTAASAGAVTAANSVFDVSVSGTGVVTLTQYSQIDHLNSDPSPTGAPFNDQLIALADGLVTLTASGAISDGDGDSANDSVAVQIGANLRFSDDGPSLAGASAGSGVVIDETAAGTPAGFPIDASSASAVIVGSGLSFGADGQAASGAVSYSLAVVGGGATPLRTAQGDLTISLVQTSASVITGTYVEGGVTRTAFTLTINTDGTVSVRQFVPLEHDVDGSTAAAFDDALDLAGLVNATITIRDFDGDTASASTGIGNLVVFRDDGPDSRLAVDAARDVLVLDETQPVGSDTAGAASPAGLASVTASFADNFAAALHGADGAGSVSYALVLNGSNVASGIHALEVGDGSATDSDPIGRGAEIVLNQSGNVITGSVGSTAYFTIAIDPATGAVTFTQLQPVFNPTGGPSFDEAAILQLAEGALLLRQTVTDSDGDSDSSSIDIGQGQFQIQDDGPLARPDADALAAGAYGPETGNLITGAGTAGGATGADSLGRDGASVVSVGSGNAADTTFDEAGNLVIQGQYGVLSVKADGSYSYVRDTGTPGGVSDVFSYTLRDTDGDTSESTLTIAIGNLPPTLLVPAAQAPGTVVDEAGLPVRNGEPEGSGEEAAAGPNGDTSESTSGTITYSEGDGPATITIDGVVVTGAGQTITTEFGTLRIESFGGGKIDYSYTLRDNLLATVGSDSIDVVVTDKDNQSASGTLVITIRDDAPDARADLDILPAGTFGPAVGNVITGDGTAAPAEGRDTVGADNATVVAVSGRPGSSDSEFDGNGNLVVNGLYGVLTIKADGSYSYARNPGTPGGVDDVFNYTLRDSDGDEDVATLTIRIGNTGPTVDAPDANAPGTLVFEAGLPARTGEPQGSGEELAPGVNGDTSETTSGIINFTQGDGPATITIGGTVVTGVAGQVITTPKGQLVIQSVANGQITYSYTLADNLLEGSAGGSDVISISVTDQDGQTANDTLTIIIRDDGPIARDDADMIDSDVSDTAVGNVISGDGTVNPTSGRDTVGDDNSTLVAVEGFESASDNQFDANGNLVVNGQYGVLTIKADGSYSYVRNEGTPGGVSDSFLYTLRDSDGTESQATLVIGIDDEPTDLDIPPVGGASTTVSELGLAARGDEPAGSGEIADNNPSNNSDPSEQVSGTFTFQAKDGLAELTIDGVSIAPGSTFPVTINSPGIPGTLVITSVTFDEATGAGSANYTFTLTDNLLGNQAVNGGNVDVSFAVRVEDSDGDSSNGSLAIRVIDDQADAKSDIDDVPGGSFAVIAGNVISGDGTTSGSAGRDIEGADDAQVISIAHGNVVVSEPNGAGNLVIEGLYGVLTIKADGSYTYARNPGTDGGVQDVFTYTLRDGDQDQDTATLTIRIADQTPQINAPNAGAPGTEVFEAGLSASRGAGETDGSAEQVAPGVDGDQSEKTSGTITYGVGDGPSVITIAGVAVTGVNQQIDTGEGVLTITSFGGGQINYDYVLKDNQLVNASSVTDAIAVTITDKDGDQASDTLNITIVDDAPNARDDGDSIAAGSFGPAVGNVISGDGTTSPATGSDIVGADNAQVVAVTGYEGSADSSFDENDNLVVEGRYGVLTIKADGSYSYARNADTPGGVEDVFTYTLRDSDQDQDTATLTIQIADQAPEINAPDAEAPGTLVYEAGLGSERGTGETDGSAEQAAPGPDGDQSEKTSGTITYAIGDGPSVITIAGTTVTGVNQQIDTGEGTLTITAFGNGTIEYDYVLKDNQLVSGSSVTDAIAVTITDKDGDQASDTLNITIIDDAPNARNDSDSIEGGTFGPAVGNVISGDGTAAPATGSDIVGADNATVVAVTGYNGSADDTFDSNGNLVVNGRYGVLTIEADGSYSYARNAGTPGDVQDVFTYTLRDNDGDEDTATLTINIGDAPVTSTIPAAGSDETLVYEEALGARGSEPEGSEEIKSAEADGDPRELVEGTITFSAKDGIDVLKLNGVDLSTSTTNQVVSDNATGTLTVTSVIFNSTTQIYTINYSYLLKDNTTSNEDPATGNTTETFAFLVKDLDGDQSGGDLVITVVDDAPVAKLDTDSVSEGSQTGGDVVLGTGTDSGAEGTDIEGADGAIVVGVAAGTSATAVSGKVGEEIQTTYGKLTLNADGSYTYKSDPNTVPAGQVVDDVFTYTIQDADGDLSTTTLTIRVSDVTLSAPEQTGTVYEAALDLVKADDDLVAGTVEGSNPTSQLETATGDIDVEGATSFEIVGSGVGTYGQISVDAATGEWVYTLKSPVSNLAAPNLTSATETFDYVAKDANGNSVPGKIVITIIDDVPTANDDSDRVTEGNGNVADGNVLTGSGGSDSNAFDGVADVIGADNVGTVTGARTGTEAGGGSFTSVPSGSGGQLISGTYGNLLIKADGSYTYTLKTDSIPTNVSSEIFTYRMKDADGDESIAQLTINFDQDLRVPAVSDSTATVYEDGLADGQQHGATSETQTGSFTVNFNGETGGKAYIGGVEVVTGQTFTTAKGVLTIGAITTAGNVTTYNYSYTLTSPQTHSGAGESSPTNDVLDTFTVEAVDPTGDASNPDGVITIRIVDDIATAANDSGSVTEGATLTVSAADGVLNNDVFGADGKDSGGGVVGVVAGGNGGVSSTGVGTTITTALGTLTLNANGSYTYEAKDDAIGTNQTDQFTYTIKDGDGDVTTAVLTINLAAVTLVADNQVVEVNEAALDLVRDLPRDLAAGTVNGSQPGLTTETVTGTLAVTGGTGITYTAQTVTTAYGVFELKTDGSFTYTLTSPVDPADNDNGTNTVNEVESFTYTAKDVNGNSITGTIKVNVIDDVPSVTVTKVSTATEDAIKLITQDADTDGSPGQDSATSSFVSAFTATFLAGADGSAQQSLTYSLGVVSGDSGLKSGGNIVYLHKIGNVVVGSTVSDPAQVIAANTVFELSVSNAAGTAGQVTLVQYQQVDHTLSFPNEISLLDSKITLTAEGFIKDGDGDTDTESQTINIGANIVFQDDAPDISASLNAVQLRIDETDNVVALGGETDALGGNLGTITLSAGDLFTVTTVNSSADQPEATTYKLVVTDNALSGYTDSSTDTAIRLYNKVGDPTTVEGRVGSSSGALAFTITMAADGTTTLTQFRGIEHTVTSSKDEVSGGMAANALQVEVSRTDYDGDKDSVLLDLGSLIRFEDDAPRITSAQNINIQNGGDVAHTGAFNFEVGSDINADNNDIRSVTMSVQVGNSTYVVPLTEVGTESASGASYSFSFTYNVTATTTAQATGTVSFNKTLDTYTIDFVNPIQPFVTINSTSQATSFLGYDVGTNTQTNSQPDVVNVQLREDNSATTTTNEALWVRLTGIDGSVSTTSTDNVLTAGELITGGQSWVSASNTANGVAGDIVNQNQILNIDLYKSNQFGTAPTSDIASASAIYFKLDNIGNQEDFVVNLKLWNDADSNGAIDDGETTTRAVYVANGDIYKGGNSVTAGPGQYSGVPLDNNDGLVIIERNDYNFGSENYVIIGAQIATTDSGLTGSAIDLNSALMQANGSGGESTPNSATVQSDSNNLGFKIQDIGFVSVTSAAQEALVTLSVTIGDADGDTVTQTLTATVSSAADSQSTITLSPEVSDPETNANTASLMVFDEAGVSAFGESRTSAANNNLALMAGLAAGFASIPAAAAPTPAATAPMADLQPALSGGQDWLAAQSLGNGGVLTNDQAVKLDGGQVASQVASGGDPIHNVTGSEVASFVDQAVAQAEALSTLDSGTDLAISAAPAPVPFAGGEIHLPSAGQMAMLGAEGLAPQQGNPSVGSIVADALSGGGLGAADIDGLIDAAIALAGPAQSHQGEEVAAVAEGIASLATPLSAAVSSWDAGDFGPLFMAASMAMDSNAQHPDAVQPAVNG